jgi:hypothetical protein
MSYFTEMKLLLFSNCERLESWDCLIFHYDYIYLDQFFFIISWIFQHVNYLLTALYLELNNLDYVKVNEKRVRFIIT